MTNAALRTAFVLADGSSLGAMQAGLSRPARRPSDYVEAPGV
jgi:hypothetical protein